MTECLCGHGEWCRHCTSIPLPPKKKEKPNYKYKSFEDLRNYLVESLITCAIDLEYAFNAARELTKEREE